MVALLAVLLLSSCDLLSPSDSSENVRHTDTDVGTDPDPAPPPPTSVTSGLSAEPGGSYGIGLQRVNPDGPGEVWFTAQAQGQSTTVDLPVPPDDHLQPLESGVQDVLAALYVSFAFEDLDGNGAHDAYEPVRGVGPLHMQFLVNTPEEIAFFGFRDGWNAVNLGGQIPVAIPLSNVELQLNLLPRTSLSLAGTADASIDEGVHGLALVPSTILEGGSLDTLLYDSALANPFVIDLTGAPPLDHIDSSSELPGLSLQSPLVYQRDAVTAFPGDDPQAVLQLCFEDEPVFAVWFPEVV